MTLKDLKLIKPNTILVDKSKRLAYKENIVLAQVIDDKELKILTCIIPIKRVREVNKLKSSNKTQSLNLSQVIIDSNKQRIKNKLNNFFNIIEMYNKQ